MPFFDLDFLLGPMNHKQLTNLPLTCPPCTMFVVELVLQQTSPGMLKPEIFPCNKYKKCEFFCMKKGFIKHLKNGWLKYKNCMQIE